MPPNARRRDDQQPDGLHNNTTVGDDVHNPAPRRHKTISAAPGPASRPCGRYAVDPSGRALTPAHARRCTESAGEGRTMPQNKQIDAETSFRDDPLSPGGFSGSGVIFQAAPTGAGFEPASSGL